MKTNTKKKKEEMSPTVVSSKYDEDMLVEKLAQVVSLIARNIVKREFEKKLQKQKSGES